MGQQYQQVLRVQKGTTQSVLEGQRAWIQQRNNRCSTVADSAIWNCLLNATKDRLDALSQLAVASNDAMAQMPSPAAAPQKSATPTPQAANAQQVTKIDTAANNQSDGTKPLLILLFAVGALYGAVKIIGNIRQKERLARERATLVAKYGELTADRILDHDIWKGMTEQQLIDSWGAPVDVDREITRTKVKETWKYIQTGRNRFARRASLDDGIVVAWKV
jgi:hypothetical protein